MSGSMEDRLAQLERAIERLGSPPREDNIVTKRVAVVDDAGNECVVIDANSITIRLPVEQPGVIWEPKVSIGATGIDLILRAARNEVLERRWFFGMMGVGV